ncbi:uncharacterized protein LOC133394092 isoform X2 [Anopheles gambiae]|uniref:uncharacterized protein LOC133394092 isoform X2 n=1 Tax=Anopheles gambiae TaxID=7165 RepID=UPI002AC8FFCA|nr:uncharacterized protein LOC133394092 isoform X2 [Anopheles gambiae]XP_061519207.1 uncharacterized protein LOC133394092 isoform X2 [Anopheles gambiae]
MKMKAGYSLLDTLEATSPNDSSSDAQLFPYTNAMERLHKYYSSHDYVFLQRQKLRSMNQNDGESDLTYVKKIIDLAKLCNYKENQLIETVVDVIQAHATNPRVRKTGIKVLRKRGSITDLLDKVRECEMEQMNDINFARTHQQNSQVQPSALVAAVSNSSYHNNGPRMGGFHRGNSLYHQKYWGMQSGRGTSRLTPSRFSSNRPSGGRREQCGRCTSNYHSSENCHAISKRCRNCHTVGHIERACRQGIQDKTKRRAEEEEAGSPAIKTRKIAAIMDSNNTPETTSDKEIDMMKVASKDSYLQLTKSPEQTTAINNDQLCSVEKGINNEGFIVGYVAGVPVYFMIDSGADVNTVAEDIYEELRASDPRTNPIYNIKYGTDRTLKAYGVQKEIPVVASFIAELYISEEHPRSLKKFYVIAKAKPLLSRSTAIIYSVLQLGLNVPVKCCASEIYNRLLPGEILAISMSGEFPKFNIAPVVLSYDRSLPPSRNVFTNIPIAFRNETEKRLEDLLSSGIIERVNEQMDKSFCSSLLVVPKGKNDIRLVVDLRGPNKCIVRSPFRMPTLEAILSKLNGASWFSTIDLTSAFFHVELHESCRHLTNFFAGNGTYRFKRLPFGLCNSPDIFQELLQTVVLADCPGVLNYLDDILVFGSTKKEHDRHLDSALLRLREHNVRLNDNKCIFGARSVLRRNRSTPLAIEHP